MSEVEVEVTSSITRWRRAAERVTARERWPAWGHRVRPAPCRTICEVAPLRKRALRKRALRKRGDAPPRRSSPSACPMCCSSVAADDGNGAACGALGGVARSLNSTCNGAPARRLRRSAVSLFCCAVDGKVAQRAYLLLLQPLLRAARMESVQARQRAHLRHRRLARIRGHPRPSEAIRGGPERARAQRALGPSGSSQRA